MKKQNETNTHPTHPTPPTHKQNKTNKQTKTKQNKTKQKQNRREIESSVFTISSMCRIYLMLYIHVPFMQIFDLHTFFRSN